MKETTYFGGVFIIKGIESPSFVTKELLPNTIFSLSDCLCESLPHTWALNWTSDTSEEKRRVGIEFGLSIQEQEKLTETCTKLFDAKKIGWPNVIIDLAIAKDLRHWVKLGVGEVKLLMIGLNPSDTDSFLKDNEQIDQESGVIDCLAKRIEIQENGKFVGFEILGFEYGSFHSWFCNSIDGDANKRFGISPNKFGFLNNYEDARKICEMANQEEYGSEPVLWIPWKVYDLE